MRDGSKHEVVQSSVIDIIYPMRLFAGGIQGVLVVVAKRGRSQLWKLFGHGTCSVSAPGLVVNGENQEMLRFNCIIFGGPFSRGSEGFDFATHCVACDFLTRA